MGGAYLLTAMIPRLFIREKMYDPHGRDVVSPEVPMVVREPSVVAS